MTNSLIKTRFAPSPTGSMHFGNLRTALFNYLVAQHNKGVFLLRIEDTDQKRSTKAYAEALIADLEWMGLNWQEGPLYQSERFDIYHGYYQQLEAQRRAYPCFCSEEKLSRTRKVQLSTGQPPRYLGTCRHLSTQEVEKHLAAGDKPALRFVVPKDIQIVFTDLIKGPQKFLSEDIGDFIIRRQDGSGSFMFVNAVDDALCGVTHVLRGDDHLTNSPRQIMILQALGLNLPTYAHFPTILGLDGQRLSKRNGSVSVQTLKEQGYQPLALANYLARLGHYYADNALFSLEQLAERFAFSHVNTAAAKYDLSQLQHWQKLSMHESGLDEFEKMITQVLADHMPEKNLRLFAKVIQPNVLFPKEAKEWAEIFYGSWQYTKSSFDILVQTNPQFFEVGIEALNKTPKTFSQLLNALKSEGFQGKALFLPLRVVMSNRTAGPTLEEIYDLLGPHEVLRRFKLAQAVC